MIGCTAEQCQCSHCGKPKAVIGYETSEQLDYLKSFALRAAKERKAAEVKP